LAELDTAKPPDCDPWVIHRPYHSFMNVQIDQSRTSIDHENDEKQRYSKGKIIEMLENYPN